MKPPPSPRAARLALVGAAALFSTGGTAIKLCALSGWAVAGARAAVAGLFLLVASSEARALRSRAAWLVGLAYAATTILFVLANRETTAAAAVFLQSTAPLYALALGILVLGERPARADLVALVLLALALALFLARPGESQASAPRPALGNALAACAGVTWSLTLTGLRRLAHTQGSSMGAVCAGNLLAAAACAAVLGAGDAWPAALGARDAVALGWLGVFQIGLAYLLVGTGLRATPVFQASLLLLVEPVLASALAWVVHGEVLPGAALAGGALVLATCVVRALGAAPAAARASAP